MSSYPPHRNRLLALEQELQARRTVGNGKRKQRPPKTSTLSDTPSPASPLPSSSSLSPWQVLANRLTQNHPIRYIPKTRKPDLPLPDLTPEQSTASVRRSTVPYQQKSPPIHPPITPLPVSVTQSIDPVPLDDDASLDNWQDLAAQIRQARSPQPQSQRQSALLPSSAPPETEIFEVEDSTTLEIVPAYPTTETAIVPAKKGALVPHSQADRGILTRYAPTTTGLLVAAWRSPQLQRAIPLLAGFILPCVLFKAQFLPSTPGSQVPSTGDILCVPRKIDSRN